MLIPALYAAEQSGSNIHALYISTYFAVYLGTIAPFKSLNRKSYLGERTACISIYLFLRRLRLLIERRCSFVEA